MTSPRAKPAPEKSHEHIDLGALMDGSERGPEVPEEEWANRGARGAHGAAGAYGEAADLSGETADGYVSGQDEGSID